MKSGIVTDPGGLDTDFLITGLVLSFLGMILTWEYANPVRPIIYIRVLEMKSRFRRINFLKIR